MDHPFVPDWASPPGETAADIMHERKLWPIEVAKALGMDLDQFLTFLSGGTTITMQLAKKLEETLGGTAEFWMTRDRQYRESLEQGQAVNAIVQLELLRQEEIAQRGEKPSGEPSDGELLVGEIMRLRHSNAALEAEVVKLHAERLQLTMQVEIEQHNRRLGHRDGEEAP